MSHLNIDNKNSLSVRGIVDSCKNGEHADLVDLQSKSYNNAFCFCDDEQLGQVYRVSPKKGWK